VLEGEANGERRTNGGEEDKLGFAKTG